MSGRPDFDVGDLVVCVSQFRTKPETCPAVGSVWVVEALLPPDINKSGWGVHLVGKPTTNGFRAYAAFRFRKLNPKPPEFFAGKIDEPVKENA